MGAANTTTQNLEVVKVAIIIYVLSGFYSPILHRPKYEFRITTKDRRSQRKLCIIITAPCSHSNLIHLLN